MKLDRYTILHRKDERGVIVESGVFGPDDEVPEGFGTADYQPIYAVREDDQAPVAEVDQKPWSSPIAKGSWVENRPEDAPVDDGTPWEAREELTGAEQEALDDLESVEDESESEDESDEGSPREAREQSEDGELTDAETEADEELESDEDASESEDETDAGTPMQALSQSEDVQAPPQGGPGSGKEAWTQYAAAKSVTVPEDASRDEIIAACKKAGVPVD